MAWLGHGELNYCWLIVSWIQGEHAMKFELSGDILLLENTLYAMNVYAWTTMCSQFNTNDVLLDWLWTWRGKYDFGDIDWF